MDVIIVSVIKNGSSRTVGVFDCSIANTIIVEYAKEWVQKLNGTDWAAEAWRVQRDQQSETRPIHDTLGDLQPN